MLAPVLLTGGAVLLREFGLERAEALAVASVLTAGLLGVAALAGARRTAALEERAGEAFVRLQRAEEQRDAMFADVSHELRSPLTVILAELDLLARGPLSGRSEQLEALYAEAAEMRRRVDDLLALAALRAGASTLEPARGDLAAVVRAAATRLETVAGVRGTTLVVSTPHVVPADFDRLRLHGALSNLIENAIKHGRPGGLVEVAVRRVADRRVEIVIEDDGPGIPAEEREHVFERFARGDGAQPGAGSGVGLAIVRDVVEAHGGTITAGDGAGGGARFTLGLPCAAPGTELPAAPRGPATGAPPARDEVPADTAAAPRVAPVVLLIDDQPAVLTTLTAVLRDHYEVLGAADAQEAVRCLRDDRPALVVTDQIEPGPGFASIVDELVAGREGAGPPLVVMTGDPVGADRAEARADVSAVLRKPFSAEELEATLARVLPPDP